jgi:hypothetical protein
VLALAAHDRTSPTQRNPPLGVGLMKDVVSDDPREHMAGDVPSRSGKRQYSKREKYKDAISDTVASYAISDEQGARKKLLDNRQ